MPDCRIGFAGADARRRLARFFARPRKAETLPPEICRWLETADQSRRPLIAQRGGSRLIVRRVAPAARHAVALTLELLPSPARPRSAADQRLTAREVEVLEWLSEGKTTPLIAEILHLSQRTVSKHIEHILEKLGVETRTAAAASYLQDLAGRRSARPRT